VVVVSAIVSVMVMVVVEHSVDGGGLGFFTVEAGLVLII
jgi:hypothetical protein